MSPQVLNTLNTGPFEKEAPQGWLTQAGRLLQELRFLVQYHLLAGLQAPFNAVFWLIEQRNGRITDKLAKPIERRTA